MIGKVPTVEEYLAEQSLERREALAAVRRVILHGWERRGDHRG